MDNPQRFNFLKARSLQETIKATFDFIRQEFIPMGKPVLFITGPFLIISAIINNWYFDLNFYPDPNLIFSTDFWSKILVLWFIQVTIITLMIIVVNQYILMYIRKDENRFNIQSILNVVLKDFWRIMGISILYTFIVSLAFVFFVIPGIYLFVVLSLLYVIIIHEGVNINEAVYKSMYLIRNFWWVTFGLLIFSWISVYFLQILLQAPLIYFSSSTDVPEVSTQLAEQSNNIWTSVSVFAANLSYMFYTIVIVALAVHYYSLRESKKSSGPSQNKDAYYEPE